MKFSKDYFNWSVLPITHFSSPMPYIASNHTVVFPWISACHFDLVSFSALPLSYKNIGLSLGKKGLPGFDTFKMILEVNKGLSLTIENSMGKGVGRKSLFVLCILRSQVDHTQFAHQLQYDFPTRFLTTLKDIYTH